MLVLPVLALVGVGGVWRVLGVWAGGVRHPVGS
jgi:hypothetical protein